MSYFIVIYDPEQAVARFGGRRFTMVGVCVFLYTALLVGAYIDPRTYFELQVLTVGAFIAGSGHQKHIEAKYDKRTDVAG